MRVFDPRKVLSLVEQERVTVVAMNPTMAELCLRTKGGERFDLSSLLAVGLGASNVSPALAERVKERFQCAVAIGYGSTELGGGVLATNLFDPEDRQTSTVGRPFHGSEVAILGDEGRPVNAGEIGELACRSPGLMLGYQHSERPSHVDHDGWYHTGDLATMDRAGYVRIVGRRQDLIIRSGQNVYASEIEAVLEANPAVQAAAIVGVPEPLAGERIWGYVVPAAGRELNSSELLAFCRGKLAASKMPDRFLVVDELPLTPDGKVKKFVLRRAALQEIGGRGRDDGWTSKAAQIEKP